MISQKKISLFIAGFVLVSIFTYFVSQIYRLFSSILVVDLWLGAAILNTIFAAYIAYHYKPSHNSIVRKNIYNFLPAIIILLVQLCLAITSSLFIEPAIITTKKILLVHVLWVLWIPIVEEFVFRVGVGGILKKRFGSTLGSYFSIMCFAMAHTLVEWNQPLAIFYSIPLGALLVGLCCELIYVYTGRIGGAILFHMAANFSVISFIWIDQRWLNWLDFLFH